jgi:hypothetical protein
MQEGITVMIRRGNLAVLIAVMLIPACAMDRSIVSTTDNRACFRNFSSEGSFVSGKTFKTYEEFVNLRKTQAIESLAQAFTSTGQQIKTLDKNLGIITATVPVILGQGNTVALNGSVTELGAGSRIQLTLQLYPTALTSTDSVQKEFCKVLAEVASSASTLSSRQERDQASSRSKKFRSIEEIDFANFTFPPVEDCGEKPASLKMGRYEDKEVRVQLTPERVSPGKKIIYADLTGEKINQAIVPLYCDTYGNFFITEIFLYALRNGEPVLIAKLPESIMERDYKKYYPDGNTWGGISKVAANNGKITFYKAADGYHACPKNDVRFEYAWNGKSFVLSGKPVKRPLKDC